MILKQARTHEYTHENFVETFSVDYLRPRADEALQVEHAWQRVLDILAKKSGDSITIAIRDVCNLIAFRVTDVRADGVALQFSEFYDKTWAELGQDERAAVFVTDSDLFMWPLVGLFTLGAGKTAQKKQRNPVEQDSDPQ